MNTNSLKRFATQSRTLLMQGVRTRLSAVGFNADGSVAEEPKKAGDSVIFGGEIITDPQFYPRWTALRQRIAAHGVKDIIEEAAYTWFNRLMAIRILVRNGLCAPVLDYENPEVRLPRIVTDARAGRVSGLSDTDRANLDRIIEDGRRSFEQFSILITSFCATNPIVSACFGGITDYTALLLPSDILGEGGFLDLLNSSDEFIEKDDWRKPELIGWLYQFYISEKKDEVFAKKGGYDSDEIPAATQIFTPNWIVKYMVENTLGRIYLDNNPDSDLAESWKYLVEPAEPTPEDAKLRYDDLEELKCADLSCGSGHILNDMFDLLMQLYREDFYSPRQAVEAIFTQNMVGIDLDIRARQLAQFALLLKACQTDAAFADGHCLPRIYSFPDVKADTWLHYHGEFVKAYSIVAPSQRCVDEIYDSLLLMEDADALGSIMKFYLSEETRDYLRKMVAEYDASPRIIVKVDETPSNKPGVGPIETYFVPDQPKETQYIDSFAPVIDAFRILLALTEQYAAICMNPPYMPTNKEERLKNYAAKNYPDSKSDLFAVFMDVAIDRLTQRGKYGMINMQSWMFLSSFEKLREKIIDNQQIDSLLHLGPRTFDELSGEVVQNAAFVISNERPEYPGVYYRLVDGKSCSNKQEMFLAGDNRFTVSQKLFENIPGSRLGYWISDKVYSIFSDRPSAGNIIKLREGIHTGKNELFIRNWHEVDFTTIVMNANSYQDIDNAGKFVPYNKGGSPRKWYGNNDLVVRFDKLGRDSMSSLKGHVRPSQELYFKEGATWSSLSSGKFALRAYPKGFLFDSKGQVAVGENWLSILTQFNSNLYQYLADILMPTLDYKCGDVKLLPYTETNQTLQRLALDNIAISKEDWDAHETSWEFQTNELIRIDADEVERIISERPVALHPDVANQWRQTNKLQVRMELYMEKWWNKFLQLHSNEEELNRRFIEIYGLQNELKPDVRFDEITILQQGEIRIQKDCNPDLVGREHPAFRDEVSFNWDVIVKQLVSYAVGVMMGRYRLDRPGLAIAHPNPTDEEVAPYIVPQSGAKWWIDDDGIVPMMGADCGFHDNAANRFDAFIEAAFDVDDKTANLNFVREALGKDVVDYFRNDFYADHKRMYQNRPIYWMFSSNQKGKRAAFQCLVYMHRMNRFTPEKVRTGYLLPYIETLSARQTELQSLPALTAKQAKELKQVTADLAECRDYQLRLHDFADRQIEIDLDDGVVKNYASFADVLAKLK